MSDYGKLNLPVSLNPTSAFPLDARTYFTSYEDAEKAAASAKEAGSTDTVYFYGQELIVHENGTSTRYTIQSDNSLIETGSWDGLKHKPFYVGDSLFEDIVWTTMDDDIANKEPDVTTSINGSYTVIYKISDNIIPTDKLINANLYINDEIYVTFTENTPFIVGEQGSLAYEKFIFFVKAYNERFEYTNLFGSKTYLSFTKPGVYVFYSYSSAEDLPDYHFTKLESYYEIQTIDPKFIPKELNEKINIDHIPIENSENPISSHAVFTALKELTDSQPDPVKIDITPTSGSSNAVSSGGVYTSLFLKEDKSNKTTEITEESTDEQYPTAKAVYDALSDKQDTLLFDEEPTEGSDKMLNSDAIYRAFLKGLSSMLTFDDEPTIGSKNPVTSEGIHNAITKINNASGAWTFDDEPTDGSLNPVTSTGIKAALTAIMSNFQNIEALKLITQDDVTNFKKNNVWVGPETNPPPDSSKYIFWIDTTESGKEVLKFRDVNDNGSYIYTKLSGGGGNASGGGGASAIAFDYVSPQTQSVSADSDCSIKFKWMTTISNDGGSKGTVSVSVNGVYKKSVNATSCSNSELEDITSPDGVTEIDVTDYLVPASTNTIDIVIQDMFGTEQKRTFYVSVIQLTISSTYKQNTIVQASTCAIMDNGVAVGYKDFNVSINGATNRERKICSFITTTDSDGNEIEIELTEINGLKFDANDLTSNKVLHIPYSVVNTNISDNEIIICSHGSHSLRVQAIATLDDGTIIPSNTLFYDLIFVNTDVSTDVIIASQFNKSKGNQYEFIDIPYFAYDPLNPEYAEIFYFITDKDGNEIQVDQVAYKAKRTQETWTTSGSTYGITEFKIVSRTTEKKFVIDLNEVKGVDVNPIGGDNLLVCLKATSGLYNDDVDNREKWVSTGILKNITPIFTNFKWGINDGWKTENGVPRLILSTGSSVEIPYGIFASTYTDPVTGVVTTTDFMTKGATIEVEFMTTRVYDDDYVFLSCKTDGVNIGMEFTPQKTTLSSNTTNVTAMYIDNIKTRISYVITPVIDTFEPDPTDPDGIRVIAARYGTIRTYINGYISGIKKYTENDSFIQRNPSNIKITSDKCTVHLFGIRVYNTSLGDKEIRNNYIGDMASMAEKINEFNKNDIYDPSDITKIQYSKLVQKIPCMTITGMLPKVKGSDKQRVNIKYEYYIDYESQQLSEKSFTIDDVQLDIQGTSSQFYPRKNYKFKAKYSEKDANGNKITYKRKFNCNGVLSDSYALADGQIAEKVFCLKADFMESSSVHNTVTANIANDMYDDSVKTPPMRDEKGYYNTSDGEFYKTYNDTNKVYTNKITPILGSLYTDQITDQIYMWNGESYNKANRPRTTIYGVPIALFHKLNESSVPEFIGKYNFNYDKDAESVFGFTEDNEYEVIECWEFRDNNNPRNTLHLSEYTNLAYNNDGSIKKDDDGNDVYEWMEAFEARYFLRKENMNDKFEDYSYMKAVTDWLVTVDIQDEEGRPMYTGEKLSTPYKTTQGNVVYLYDSSQNIKRFKPTYDDDSIYKDIDIQRKAVNIELSPTEYQYESYIITETYEDGTSVDVTYYTLPLETDKKSEYYGNEIYNFTHDTRNYRLAKFKTELQEHFNLHYTLMYYLLTDLLAMVDSRTKNMFWATWGERHALHKVLQDSNGNLDFNVIWYPILYDMDTMLGLSNEGVVDIPYYTEYDTPNAYNGPSNALWNNVEDAYWTELKDLYTTIRSKGIFSYDKFINAYEKHSDSWCASIYNDDADYKYISSTLYGYIVTSKDKDGNITETRKYDDTLYVAQGNRKFHRRWWFNRRINFVDSKYNAGDYKDNYITLRMYMPSEFMLIDEKKIEGYYNKSDGKFYNNYNETDGFNSLISTSNVDSTYGFMDIPTGKYYRRKDNRFVEFVPADPDFNIVSSVHQYTNIQYAQTSIRNICKPNEEVYFNAPAGTYNNSETIIYGSSNLTSIGNIANKYARRIQLIRADKLTELIAGSPAEGYRNDILNEVSFKNTPLLQKVDLRNCVILEGTVDMKNCNNIKEIRADGTIVQQINIPQDGSLETMTLPNTINTLHIVNHSRLKDYDESSDTGFKIVKNAEGKYNINSLRVENTNINTLDIVMNSPNLSQVHLTGVDWTLTNDDGNDDILWKIMNDCIGLNLEGDPNIPVIRGKCKVSNIKDYRRKKLNCFFNGFPDTDDEDGLVASGQLKPVGERRFNLYYDGEQTMYEVLFYDDERIFSPIIIETGIPDNRVGQNTTLENYIIPEPQKEHDWKNTYVFSNWLRYESTTDINGTPITNIQSERISLNPTKYYAKHTATPKSYITHLYKFDYDTQMALDETYGSVHKIYNEYIDFSAIESEYGIQTIDDPKNPDTHTFIYRGWGYDINTVVFQPGSKVQITEDFAKKFSSDKNGDVSIRELSLRVIFDTQLKYYVTVTDYDKTTVLYGVNSKVYYVGDKVKNLGTPKRSAEDHYTYEFEGWSTTDLKSSSVATTPSKTIVIDDRYKTTVKFFAVYKATYNNIIEFIQVDPETGTEYTVSKQYVPVGDGEKFTVPKDPEMWLDNKNEYTFIGWELNGYVYSPEEINVSNNVQRDKLFKAAYSTKTRSYRISYTQEGTSKTFPSKLSYSSATANPENEGSQLFGQKSWVDPTYTRKNKVRTGWTITKLERTEMGEDILEFTANITVTEKASLSLRGTLNDMSSDGFSKTVDGIYSNSVSIPYVYINMWVVSNTHMYGYKYDIDFGYIPECAVVQSISRTVYYQTTGANEDRTGKRSYIATYLRAYTGSNTYNDGYDTTHVHHLNTTVTSSSSTSKKTINDGSIESGWFKGTNIPVPFTDVLNKYGLVMYLYGGNVNLREVEIEIVYNTTY